MVFIGSQTVCNKQCILHCNKYHKYNQLSRLTTYHTIITMRKWFEHRSNIPWLKKSFLGLQSPRWSGWLNHLGIIITIKPNECNLALILTKVNVQYIKGSYAPRGCLVNGVWYHYGELLERNSRGLGPKKYTGKLSTPSGFLLSHFVYIFEKILH